MIHLYYGDGKGKTTAACGLAARAAGSEMKVLVTQFFKNGESSELTALSALDSIEISLPSMHFGRYRQMTEEQKIRISDCYREHIKNIIRRAEVYDLIVLDESVSAYGYGMFDKEEFLSFLIAEGSKREIVLTGRSPLPELLEYADYATEMKCVKHPFQKGIAARKGIEF